MKIAIYSRKSKYTGVGDSIENQIQMCKDFAISKYTNVHLEFDIYEDEGFSGKNINRPRFKELIKNIKKYDILVCYRLDRISRNVTDFSSTLDLLQANNCNFVSIKEQFDTTSPMGRAMIYIASVFAQLERETIAERVRDNMLEMARRGSWTGGRIPLGYDSKSTTYIDDEGNERKLVKLIKNDEELKLVKLIYDTYLKEGSLHKTEVWFTIHNIKSNSEILLEKTSLKVILQNPVYVKATPEVLEYMKNDGWNIYGQADGIHSLLSYNKTENITLNGKSTKKIKDKTEWIAAVSSCEGVIDADMWLNVQKQFARNRNTFPRLGKTNSAILTGKLKCGLCGNNMTVVHGKISKKTNKQLFYYVCGMKKKSKSIVCKNKNLQAKEVEDLILMEIEKIGFNKKKYLNALIKERNLISAKNNIDKMKLDLETKIQLQNKKIDKLSDELSMEDDEDISNAIKKKIKLLSQELRSFNQELHEIKSKTDNKEEVSTNPDSIYSILNNCINVRNLSIDNQKKLINLIVDSVIYYGDNKCIKLNLIGSKKE